MDGGETWHDIGVGLEGQVLAIAVDPQRPGRVYASTESGIYSISRPQPTPTVVETEEALPTAFNLLKNYPNPFNAGTNLLFSLSEKSRIELAIYNLLGQRVRTIADGSRKPGTHSVYWDGRDDSGTELASGVYFYRLETGGIEKTRKLLLIR